MEQERRNRIVTRTIDVLYLAFGWICAAVVIGGGIYMVVWMLAVCHD